MPSEDAILEKEKGNLLGGLDYFTFVREFHYRKTFSNSFPGCKGREDAGHEISFVFCSSQNSRQGEQTFDDHFLL